MDYEALGRLLGLALWQSCTLDLPLHPHLCALLCGFEQAEEASLASIDEELARMKVKWLLENSLDELGFDLPFSDPLGRDDVREGEPPPTASPSSAVHPSSASSSSSSAGGLGSSTADDSVEHAGQEATAINQAEASEPEALPSLVRPQSRLPGDARSWPGRPLKRVGASEVALDDGALDHSQVAVVTEDNKEAFTKALTAWRVHRAVSPQIEAMACGLRKVVPESVLCELRGLLSPAEVAQLLSGLGEIDVDDWERHSAYTQGFSRESDLSKWFWRLVRDWAASPEDRTRLPQLLQFVTGSARVPVGGFAELVGFNGAKHPFTLSGGSHLTPQSLPISHACICTLDLPPYEDEATCRTKLTQMLSLGRSHFDEAAGQAQEDA